MKKFNKFLAIVLVLIMVITALPISAMADAWLDVDAEELPAGDGTKVTVTLDAKALAQLLVDEGVSKDTLKAILANATIDRDELLQVFTIEDLFQIVPKEKILELFNLDEIINQIGIEKLSTYIDIPALLAGCDKYELAQLVRNVPELHKYADVETLIAEGYISNEVILENIKQDELRDAVANIDPDSVIPAILALPTFADIQRVIRVYDMVLVDGIIDPVDVMNVAEVETVAKELFEDPTFRVADYVDCVYGEAAKVYFENKYSDIDLDSEEDVTMIRDMIAAGYFEITFDYHVDSVDLVALIDNGFLNPDDVKHDVEAYLNGIFSTMSPEQLQQYADEGVFTYTILDPLNGTYEITDVDIHAVLDKNIVTVQELRENTDLGIHMEEKIDEWTHDEAKLEQLMDLNCIQVTINGYAFDSIDYEKLVADGYVTATEMLTNNLVDVNKLALALIEDGKLPITESLIDNAKLKVAVEAIPAADLVGYVNATEAIAEFGTEQIIEWLGGVENAMNCIDVPGVTEDILNTLPTIMHNLEANGVALTDVFYLDQLLPHLDLAKVVDLIGVKNILAQLDNNEIRELLTLIDLKGKVADVILLAYNYGMKNIDKLTLNGYVVAEEDETNLLKVDAAKLLNVLESLIPTLDELANLDSNTLTSLDFKMEYTPEGSITPVTKHIVFEFALEGGIDQIKAAAAKLQEILSRYINEFTVSADRIAIDLTVPNKLGAAYAELLESDKISDAVKQKIVALPDMNGDELVAFVDDQLTPADLLEILAAIEPSEVFEKAKNSAFVELVLQKLGRTVPNVTLDQIWGAVASKEISIENICDAIESKTHRDVFALLQKAGAKVDGFADRAEEIAQINRLLTLVEGRLGIDVSEISVEEILNRGADVDLLTKISNVVAAKVGVNIRSIMQNYTPDELWAKAVEKAAEHQDIYKKVRNYLMLGLEKIPDRLMNVTIANFYAGNGVFSAAKHISYDAKPVLEKLITKAVNKLNNNKVEQAIDLVMSRVESGASISTDVSVTVRFNNLNRITYMDREGTEVLFSAFLPVGADLTIYKNNSDLTGYEFTGWSDAEGNLVETMPDEDIVVYADLHSVKLTFTDAQGTVLGSILLPKGASLASAKYAPLFAEINSVAMLGAPTLSGDDAMIYSAYRLVWAYGANGLIDVEKQIGLDATFTEDTTLVCGWEGTYSISFRDPSVDFSLDYNAGLYTVTIHGDFADAYHLSLKEILIKANANSAIRLMIVIEDGNFVLASMKNATLKSLYQSTVADPFVWFEYANNAAVTNSFAGTVYEGLNLPCYSFSFTVSDTFEGAVTTVSADFAGETIDIQLPFADATATADCMTRVYTVTNGEREYVTTSVARTGLVEFAAVHFSDFVIANEYLLNFVFIPDVAGELTTDYTDANGKIYLPAGAKILLQFVIENNYEVDSITALDGTTYAVGSEFTMPAAAETLTVRVRARLYSVNYYYYDYASGTLKQAAMPYQYYTGTFDRAIALAPVVSDEARNSAPAGYGRDFTWSDLDMNQVGVTDISLFMIHTPISYTVNFVNAKDGSIISSINGLTVENYETLYKLPQAPGGLVSNWTVAWIEKPTDLNDPAQNTITVVLNGQFETVKFAIVHGAYVTDETPFEAQQGESVKVVVEDRFGYTAQIVVKNAAGELIEVTNGSFTMPAASVAISVVYTPVTFSYQINKVPGVGTYLDTIPVEITLKKGEVLTSISADCTLVSTVKNGDETVLTYSFVLDGDKTITYVVEKSKPVIYRIFNGALFNDGFMPTMDGTVNFERWSNPLFDALSFAVFSAVETECSLVWLWILIAVLALFLLIVILYVLSLKGKTVKFLTRAAVAVVGAFFALCILMAKLALKVASLFGKDDAPEDYGFTEETDKQDQ